MDSSTAIHRHRADPRLSEEIKMFYAARTQQITPTSTERQALAFYSKADRDAWLSINKGVPITAAENRTLKTAGAEYTVGDNGLGITFFARIVE